MTSEYIRYIVSKANLKLDENEKRIHKFESLLSQELGRKADQDLSNETVPIKKVYRRKNKRNRPEANERDSNPQSYDGLCLVFMSWFVNCLIIASCDIVCYLQRLPLHVT